MPCASSTPARRRAARPSRSQPPATRTFALDRSESRLARLRANLARTGLGAEILVEDVLGYAPDELYDAVLLDAPCSATGTFRRHPEVLLRASDRIIAESAELQGRLLAAAAEWVRPGGTLVYAVCSLEPSEGEEIIAAFLGQRADFSLAEQRRVLPGELEEHGGMDGFFAARLVREGLVPSNRSHGPADHRAFDPFRRLRPARRRGAGDRCGGRRLDPYRRHGRAFRAQPHHRPDGGESASAAQRQAVRRPPDDLAGRPDARRLCRSGRGHHHRPSRKPARTSTARCSASAGSARRPACRSIPRPRPRCSTMCWTRSTSCW